MGYYKSLGFWDYVKFMEAWKKKHGKHICRWETDKQQNLRFFTEYDNDNSDVFVFASTVRDFVQGKRVLQ